MMVGLSPPTEVQGHSPGQQMRLYSLARAEFSQPASSVISSTKQSAGYRFERIPCLDQDKPRMGLPPLVLLRPEEPLRSLRSVQGSLRLPGGQCAVGSHKEQFGPFCGPAVSAHDVVHCGIRLGQCVGDQPGRQQDVTPVLAEKRRRYI